MGNRRRSRKPVALPMHLEAAEAARYDATLSAIEAHGPDALRSEATLVRQQLALHASYVNACEKIERFSDELRESGARLVPLRFPIRLTHKTRACVEDGLFRSFQRFLQDLHTAVLAQHVGGVDDAVTNVSAFLTRLANALTLESCRVLDGAVSHGEARNVCLSYVEKCRLDVVRREVVELLAISNACGVLVECLRRFGRSVVQIGKRPDERMGAFVKTAERKGLCEAACRLRSHRQLREVLEKHACWLHGDAMDAARSERTYQLLVRTHHELAQRLMGQQRRIGWLVSANAANQCWCGLEVATGSVNGALVQAPAHMRSLAGEERVRLAREPQEAPYACYLSAVSVANLLLALLREEHLPLNRASATYANRILTFDFCKYERAARNILEDTVRPWYERASLSGLL
jgi:hypothetical protein